MKQYLKRALARKNYLFLPYGVCLVGKWWHYQGDVWAFSYGGGQIAKFSLGDISFAHTNGVAIGLKGYSGDFMKKVP